jgi:hypothetical protein
VLYYLHDYPRVFYILKIIVGDSQGGQKPPKTIGQFFGSFWEVLEHGFLAHGFLILDREL